MATSCRRGLAIAKRQMRGFVISQRATSVALLEAKMLGERVGGLALVVGAIGASERLWMTRRAFGRRRSSIDGAQIGTVSGAAMQSVMSKDMTLGRGEHHTNGTGRG